MIKKLSQRIFLIIMLSLSIVVLGVIILFSTLNYRNTINTASFVIDRFMPMGEEKEKPFELERKDINQNQEENIEERNDKLNIGYDIDGLYNIQINNSKIVNASENITDEKIKEYAIKVSQKNSDSGIIENYIYTKRTLRDGQVNVTLMENEEAITRIRILLILSVIISAISLVVIYVIAKKLSKVIVKPVEETFEKQKEFISDASHELKTPLAVIQANSDVLENEIGENKWLKYIQKESDSMNKLINELLLLTKIENVDNIEEYKDFNLSEEAEIVVSMFESMAYENNVKIESNIQENIKLNGKKEDVEHILSTLVDNAIKHTVKDGKVIVNINKEKNNIVIEVKNNGEEIPIEERDKIFERFYRVDKARNRNEKRYGLGLAIAKSTVEKYNGKIDVDYKEGYTIFKVTL